MNQALVGMSKVKKEALNSQSDRKENRNDEGG